MESSIAVDIGDIESELQKLWRESDQKGEIKACLFNLIVYAHDERRVAYLNTVAHSIVSKFPCRVIIIQGHLEDFPSMKVHVSTEIISRGNQKIASDEMQIDVGQKQLSRIPNLIIPHLVSDLPIYLLWGQDPTSDNEILPYLEKYASKIIFDSECTSNLQDFSKGMQTLMDASKAEVMDLNWANISSWRDAIATMYNTPESLEELKSASQIKVTFNSVASEYIRNHEIRAIYFQGWLAGRLGWKFDSADATKEPLSISYSGGKHHVELIGKEMKQFDPGSILSLEITTSKRHYIFNRHETQPKVIVHTSNQDHCEMPITLAFPDIHRSSVFMQEVFYQSATGHYREMLETIAPIHWEGKS